MAPKTAKRLIKDTLADLTKENFEKFIDELLDREGEPRVKRNQLEDKSFIVVANVLVSTFTELRAPAVVVELLRAIGCTGEATKLENEIGGRSSYPGPSDTVRPSVGPGGGCTGDEEMAPKTAKRLIKDTLANLTDVNFKEFIDELLDREGEPRVKRNQVENKSFIVVADVLVSTFTEPGALDVVVELLGAIGCKKEATKLENEIGGRSSNPGPSDTVRPSAGAEGGCTGEHFVVKHRAELIDRVSNIPSILDQLFEKKVITQETYDEILAITTTRDKMRKLYSGPLNAAGYEGKEVFYKILEEKESYLVADLKKKK
ncbi:apoptosis-associated speck-like protein containing a CARD [Cebidichthys violaceus]|uniref:apoptosis-associated speck-like protein containing a CARD n=1 Tax=Cebidichthys violaceus TaxID=271503 RepID=UPI0035CBB656